MPFNLRKCLSLDNRMHKRLLPQSPISCEHKQPTQKRPKAREKMLLQLFSWQWHYAITACHSAWCNSKRWSSWWPATLTDKQVSSALYPWAAAPHVASLTTAPASRALPSHWVSSHPPTVKKCWKCRHAAAAKGEPLFHPAAHAPSVPLHKVYQGCEHHCYGAELSAWQ